MDKLFLKHGSILLATAQSLKEMEKKIKEVKESESIVITYANLYAGETLTDTIPM